MAKIKLEAWQELYEQEQKDIISLRGSTRKRELKKEILSLLPDVVTVRIEVENYDCEKSVEWWHPETYKVPKEKIFDEDYLKQEVEAYVEVDYNDAIEFAVLDISWELVI